MSFPLLGDVLSLVIQAPDVFPIVPSSLSKLVLRGSDELNHSEVYMADES